MGSAETLVSTRKAAPTWRAAGLRYYKYSHFLVERFGGPVRRVSVDGGFTCPNVDGTVAVGGCVYCDNRSFSPARRLPRISITEQIDHGIASLEQGRASNGYLAYFQAATNTYAPVERLKRLYDEALSHPAIIGLVVGTRPDCVGDDVLNLLEGYSRDGFVAIEYGLQSIHERSLQWMNRGHSAWSFFDAVERTRGRGIDTSAHVILGLPGESIEDMLATADAIASAGVDGVKIHNLHVVRDTPLAEEYHAGRVKVFDVEEYLDILTPFLERLPASMVIHRVTGDAPKDYLVAPDWVLRKAEFLGRLDRRLQSLDTWQGNRQ